VTCSGFCTTTMFTLRTLLEPCSSRTASIVARGLMHRRPLSSSSSLSEKKGEQPQTAALDNIELTAVSTDFRVSGSDLGKR